MTKLDLSTQYTEQDCGWLSSDFRKFGEAFAQAKKQFKSIQPKSETTQYKKNGKNAKYASLDDIYNAVESALLDQEIVIVHARGTDGGVFGLNTRLIHYPTGQYISDFSELICEKPGNQGMGAALTYAKKYAVLDMCSIACGEDDDGAAESKHIEDRPPLTADQCRILGEALKSYSKGPLLLSNILKFNQIKVIEHLPAEKFDIVIDYINKHGVK